MHYNFVAIIVSYNPVVDDIVFLINEMRKANAYVIIVDNSVECDWAKLNETLGNEHIFELLLNHENIGLAAAQNIGIKKAMQNGAGIIAFFDQDSKIDTNSLLSLYIHCSALNEAVIGPLSVDSRNGNIYPVHRIGAFGIPRSVYPKEKSGLKRTDIIISSGMFIPTAIFRKFGFMDEVFFIDYIDIEFCLRCRANGVPIFIDTDVVMQHAIGNFQKKIVFINEVVHTSNRSYYKMRNSIIMLSFRDVPVLFSLYQISATIFHSFVTLLVVKRRSEYIHAYLNGFFDGIACLINEQRAIGGRRWKT